METSDGTVRDTIAAVATAPGVGGIGVVRISGPAAPIIASKITGRTLVPRTATYALFKDTAGDVIDSGVAVFFAQPNSYTGEDVLELQGHGGPVVLDMVLSRVIELGARPARAGEFSERAFLNQKIDLAQAEAVADLIDASSQRAAKLAQRSLQGHFSDHVNRLMSELVELRAYIEAGIDFPDEEIDLLSEGDVHARIERVREKLNETVRAASQGRMLREGIQVVLAGRPNVGKSSLLNAMVGQERAIVTNIPGTTRDTVEQDVVMSGMQVTLTDTAGLRDADDRVEAQGVARARAALDDADIALFVRDAGDAADASIAAQDDALLATLPIGVPVLVVWNKADLLSASENDSPQGTHDILVSAKTGRGIEDLRGAIVESVGYDPAQEGLFMARRRHLGALEQASSYVQRAVDLIAARLGLELIAEELRLSTIALGEITGEFTTEALLDQIFSRFCIGK